MTYPFRNFVFEGGGVKGIAYVGALQALEANGIVEIERVAGNSAGAINAIVYSLDYSLEDTFDILANLDFKNFMDDSWGILRDATRLFTEYGIYKGNFFKKWMGELIAQKTGNKAATFKDFKEAGFKDLHLIGTNLSTGFSEVFSFDTTPDMPVVEAGRISLSIPIFFKSIKSRHGDIYVDGGLFNNYPIKLFDKRKYVPKEKQSKHCLITEYYQSFNNQAEITGNEQYVFNKETLGFRLDSKSNIAVFRDHQTPDRRKIKNFHDYAEGLISALFNVQNDQHLHGDDWQRTVYINTLGIGTTDFSLSNDKKRELIRQGALGVAAYLEWYNAPNLEKLPVNHPEFT